MDAVPIWQQKGVRGSSGTLWQMFSQLALLWNFGDTNILNPLISNCVYSNDVAGPFWDEVKSWDSPGLCSEWFQMWPKARTVSVHLATVEKGQKMALSSQMTWGLAAVNTSVWESSSIASLPSCVLQVMELESDPRRARDLRGSRFLKPLFSFGYSFSCCSEYSLRFIAHRINFLFKATEGSKQKACVFVTFFYCCEKTSRPRQLVKDSI